MSGPTLNNKTQQADLARANHMQNLAADPLHSVFVSANAGSGKTRVLVSRVSRLLLEGSAPEKILCLTYTKAAAAEMQERLFATLGKWSVMSDRDLSLALDKLHNQSGSQQQVAPTRENSIRPQADLKMARLLFARALETPGGLKVQTIHAFCEKILKRFPLEAGILPASDALDDRDKAEMLAQIIRSIETEISNDKIAGRETPLSRAVSLLAAVKSDQDLDGLYQWAIGHVYRVDQWRDLGGMALVAEHLGLAQGADTQMVKTSAWQNTPLADIEQAATDMLAGGGSINTTKAGLIIEAIALGKTDEAAAFDLYASIFLQKSGKPNAWKVSKAGGDFARALFGDKNIPDGPERVRVFTELDRVCSVICLQQTQALYDLSLVVVARYEDEKKRRRVIDFNDQIHLVRQLLCDTQAQDWVRYKLDGGVSHVLVDEAQDTSDMQWDIVDALSEPFFQPSPDQDPRHPRTLFAVGDEKQSIYSFQGARPELFLQKIQSLNERHVHPDRPASTSIPQVQMQMSFRSNPQILQLVDQVFYEDRAILESFDRGAMPEGSDLGQHTAFRSDQGVVEFWPASKSIIVDAVEDPWQPVPVDAADGNSSREQLAEKIAKQIKTWLDQGTLIFDRKLVDHSRENNADDDVRSAYRPMRAGDIMILVTKRSAFYKALIRNLKAHNVPLAGADRLSLRDALCIADLISLAKFVLLPADDLSLGEVLKSPLFGWPEDALFALSRIRNVYQTKTLWGALRKASGLSISDFASIPCDTAALSRLSGPGLGDLLWIKSMARRHAPYEFFARILAYVPQHDIMGQDGNDDSLLQRFYNRMGTEITDHIEAFLAQSLAHQRYGAPSLRQFIAGLERDTGDLKRDMDGVFNEVRVMTVHGAKGLESPVVILPDTTILSSRHDDPVLPILTPSDQAAPQFGGYLLKPVGVSSPRAVQTATQEQVELRHQENLRLLYVALTRAESRLLICGFESHNQVAADSWHDRLQRAMTGMAARALETPCGEGLVLGQSVEQFGDQDFGQSDREISTAIQVSPQENPQENPQAQILPSWARRLYQQDDEASKGLQYYSPSHLGRSRDGDRSIAAVRSPLERASEGDHGLENRFARGNHIHKLLQVLPDLPMSLRNDWAQRYLKTQYQAAADHHGEIIQTVLAVLNHDDFAPFFAPPVGIVQGDTKANFSRAEISVAGRIADLPSHIGFNGQIDRLCVVDGVVWVLDYKSNRPPPKTPQDLPLVYVRQMAAYRGLAREIFKDKPVRTAILWTDGPRLMIVPDDILDEVNWDSVF